MCPRPTNLLGNTAYHQQIRALSLSGTPNLSPRTAFINDLITFITTLQERGHDIILGGDFNEALDDRNSGIMKLATSTNLTDPFLYRFPHHDAFGTYVYGQRRIDSVFVSPSLLPSLTKIGYAPFQYATRSDHRPLIVEFNTKALFGYRTVQNLDSHHRAVRSNDKLTVYRFVTKWY